MKEVMKNKWFVFLMFMFVGVNILDIISTFSFMKHTPLAESNPVFYLIGNWFWLFKVVVVLLILYYMSKPFDSEMKMYWFVNVLVLSTIMTGYAVFLNFTAAEGLDTIQEYNITAYEELIEYVEQIPQAEKNADYFNFAGGLFILPILFNMISFFFYLKLRKDCYKPKENQKV